MGAIEDNIECDSVNIEIQEACREVLGLKKEKTLLTLAEFYAPTPEGLDSTTAGKYCFRSRKLDQVSVTLKFLYRYLLKC